MRLSLTLLMPAIAGMAQATTASVQGLIYGQRLDAPKNGNGLVITPRQLRLAVAANLDLSQYHALTSESSEVDSDTVEVINTLVQKDVRTLYDDIDDWAETEPRRCLAVVRGSSKEIDEFVKHHRKHAEKAYHMQNPYSFSVPESSVRLSDMDRLVEDLKVQAATTDSEVLEFDLSKSGALSGYPDDFLKPILPDYLLTILMVNTDTTTSHAPANAFGSYTMPNTSSGKRQSEAPVSEIFFVSSSSDTPSRGDKTNATHPLRKLPALCYASLDACTNATNNCSGHGECFRKYGPEKGASGQECFACNCLPVMKGQRTTYWGGAACQKEDVSSQFWILAGFSVLLMGLVGWAIGMMFSIGNEKLPGVIGAGVAPKTR